MAVKKILLDTDIGSDIDDAIALTYLLCNKQCDLLGITTVSGECVRRAMVADVILKYFDREIPLYPGIDKPLIRSQHQPLCQQWQRLVTWEHRENFEQNKAIEFMRTTIEKNPGEITLAVIGPATNIAVLFTLYPHLVPLVNEVVQMIGYYTGNQPIRGSKFWEWNSLCDPHAAQILFNMPLKRHRCFGLDVTLELLMSKDEVLKRFTAPALKPVVDFSHAWFNFTDRINEQICFHDPLAVAAVFDETLCSYAKGNIEVEMSSGRLFGITYFTPSEDGRHEVAIIVDRERFLANFFEVIQSY